MTAVISACILKNLPKLVNFCVAILILKMEKKRNIFGLICFIISRKVNTSESQKQIFAIHVEGAMTDRTCLKWFVKVLAS